MSSSAQALPRAAEDARPTERPGVALAIIVSCQLMLIVDASIVNVALPSIQRGLHFSPIGLAWVPSLYTLVFGGLLLAGGRMGDVLGRRRMLVAGIALFTVASLAGGFATSSGWLLTTRAFQGAGAALAAPGTLSLIAATFPPGQARNRALGAFSAAAGAGVTIGYVLGGVLTAELSWRWVMFINVPFGTAILFLAPRFIAEPERHPGRIDVLGACTATLGLGALTYAFIRVADTGWTNSQALGAFVAAAVLLAAFLGWQSRTTHPIMPLRLFTDRNRAIGLANMFLLGAALAGTIYFLSQLLQEALGMGPLRAGLAVLPMALTQIASSRAAPRLVSRIGPKPSTVTGTVLIAAAMAWLSRISTESGYVSGILGPMLLFGIGIGLCFMPLNMMILSDVPREDSGAASGLLQTTQRTGSSVGVAVLVTAFGVASRHAAAHPATDDNSRRALIHGIAAGFTLATLFCACALLLALAIVQPPRRSSDTSTGVRSR
ncbi:MFS transporter [Frankia sp. AgB1.9]|uniref:MFS transporter n=1 Tax=unclassified Frankia TaxID=2632575 RepID=UPI0019335F50|nr:MULTISPECIES: MFS transporter [unclassified Frankia]MBL7493677.1 MFS transporter [Frankia sp. AgW1.1]MBL7552996.1 MFS transporter [Frankia sp. AgB1.9]MBL7624581.1 MFS transporter [Frankia sp. AgB1.8]